jgi:hypothetical protein
MTSADMVTDFVIRKDRYETPMGTFTCHEKARQACIANDMDPYTCIKAQVEMSTVGSLIKALNAFCGHLAEEYNFAMCLDLVSERDYRGKEPKPEPSRIPQKYRWLIAFAVEGGSEGYYVHLGAMLGEGRYQEFGLAKTNTSESAYELAKQASRFLAAAAWN